MLIFAIDDERTSLRLLHAALEEAEPEAQIRDYPRGEEAVRAVEEGPLRPDFVFTGIQMSGQDGLRLAQRLRQLDPGIRVVFVTDHPEYAVDALRMHADGFILKPATAGRVGEELRYYAPDCSFTRDKLKVQCFGRFEVFWQGEPLLFGRKQTKELLAYLIDQEGAICTAEEIAAVLWEDGTDIGAMKTRIRQLVSDLKAALAGIGLQDALIRRRGQLGIRRDRVECDYYRMLEGNPDAMNAFRGEYMSQYSWASISEGRLYFKHT